MFASSMMRLFALVACVLAVTSSAAPTPDLVAPLSAPSLVAPVPVVAPAPAPVVTAYSSQYVARNYNGIAVAPAVVPSAAYFGGYPQVYAPAAASYTGPLVEEYIF